MTDIDKRIAVEVMNYPVGLIPGKDHGPGIYSTAGGSVIQGPDSNRFSPSTRIDHVWEAVEKLNLWSMEWHRMDDGRYDVTVWTDSDNPYGGLGETVAEGICKALLAAVEKQE